MRSSSVALATAAVAVTLTLAACSTEAEMRADAEPESAEPESAEPTPADEATDSPALTLLQSTGVPLTDSSFSCQPGRGPQVLMSVLQVDRPVTLDAAEIMAPQGIEPDDAFVVPAGADPQSASTPGTRPDPAFRVAWDERVPLAGAELAPGSYQWVVRYDVARLPAALDGVALTWTEDDGTADGVEAPGRIDYRTRC